MAEPPSSLAPTEPSSTPLDNDTSDIASTRSKRALVERIKALGRTEHDELLLMLKAHGIAYTQNTNGVFVNLSGVSIEVLQKMHQFVDFCISNMRELDDYDKKLSEMNAAPQPLRICSRNPAGASHMHPTHAIVAAAAESAIRRGSDFPVRGSFGPEYAQSRGGHGPEYAQSRGGGIFEPESHRGSFAASETREPSEGERETAPSAAPNHGPALDADESLETEGLEEAPEVAEQPSAGDFFAGPGLPDKEADEDKACTVAEVSVRACERSADSMGPKESQFDPTKKRISTKFLLAKKKYSRRRGMDKAHDFLNELDVEPVSLST
jgi:hypothetical protein